MVLLVIYANFISTQYLFYTDSRGKDTPWHGWAMGKHQDLLPPVIWTHLLEDQKAES